MKEQTKKDIKKGLKEGFKYAGIKAAEGLAMGAAIVEFNRKLDDNQEPRKFKDYVIGALEGEIIVMGAELIHLIPQIIKGGIEMRKIKKQEKEIHKMYKEAEDIKTKAEEEMKAKQEK